MMNTPILFLLECDCCIDNSINNVFYHVLLGMNFLDQFTIYEIKPIQITLVDKQNIIILDRTWKNFTFLSIHTEIDELATVTNNIIGDIKKDREQGRTVIAKMLKSISFLK